MRLDVFLDYPHECMLSACPDTTGVIVRGATASACGKSSFAFQAAMNISRSGGVAHVLCHEGSLVRKMPTPRSPLESASAEQLERIQFTYCSSLAQVRRACASEGSSASTCSALDSQRQGAASISSPSASRPASSVANHLVTSAVDASPSHRQSQQQRQQTLPTLILVEDNCLEDANDLIGWTKTLAVLDNTIRWLREEHHIRNAFFVLVTNNVPVSPGTFPFYSALRTTVVVTIFTPASIGVESAEQSHAAVLAI